MYRILLATALFLTLTVAQAQVKNILDIEGGEATAVGIYIKSLADDRVIVNENASIALTPASVTKAVTTATALNLLGTDFRFTTNVSLIGKKNGTTWNGDLVINAVGDPTIDNPELKFGTRFTDSIISRIQRQGITKITGSIIIHQNMPDAGPIPQWEVEDIAWPYGAGVFGFNFAGNYVKVFSDSTTAPESDLNVDIRTSTDGHLDILRGVNSNNLIVWTSTKNRQNPKWSVNATIPDPSAIYVPLLCKRLKAAGITIGDKAANVSGDTKLIYAHQSPTLNIICRDLMKRSDNLFAEAVLRAFAQGESRENCLKRERDFWVSQGLEPRLNFINDGSGLTRANRISPLFLGNILEKMADCGYASVYLDFFPIAGVDGTLKSFLEKTRLKGRLALKTGSVRAVQTYAGYKLDAEGRPTHIVVIMVNGFFCTRASLRKKIEAYLLKIFSEN